MSERVFSQTFGVVGAILEKDGKFLLMQEAGGAEQGTWSHPAGWIDVGENPVEAAKREVLEESGYEFEPTHLLGIYSLVRTDRTTPERGTPHAIKLIFIGTINDEPQALADDSVGTKWYTSAEIEAMDGETLRDVDIKQMVRDFQAGQRFDLSVLTHTIQK
jgi:phosphatase NudJ